MQTHGMSRASLEALHVLGSAIRAGRVQRRWTMAELAERVGVSRPTVSKVEAGDPTVAVGTFFEAATLVGVPLFEGEQSRRRLGAQKQTELALLPQRVRRPREVVDDDF